VPKDKVMLAVKLHQRIHQEHLEPLKPLLKYQSLSKPQRIKLLLNST